MNAAALKHRSYRSVIAAASRPARGFTLLELMIVLAILALGAMAVRPAISSSNQAAVDLVADKVAAALRFTRSEAIRTGIAHGVILDHDDSEATGRDIVVYQLDISASPFRVDHIVHDPITKQPYDLALIDAKEGLAVAIRNAAAVFRFEQVGNRQHLHFDAAGRPVYYVNGKPNRLLAALIEIGDESTKRTVTLSTLTGQVTVE